MSSSRALLVAGLLIVAACTGDDDAGPAPTTDPTVPTTVIDRSGIALAGVRGTTTTTVIETGTTVIRGTVTGPNGPVAGATVRIERLLAEREVRHEVPTDATGAYSLQGLPGGRFRVRAFLPPTLAQLKPEVRFLAAGRDHVFDLVVEQQSGLIVRADVAPEPPVEGQAVNLVALVANRSVGADGVVRSVPVVGTSVELIGLGRWQLRGGDSGGTATTTSTSTPFPTGSTASTTTTTTRRDSGTVARTDSSGRVHYELRCVSEGSPGLALRIPITVTPPPGPDGTPGTPQTTTQTVALDLPACVDPSSLTTTTAAASSSSSASSSTASTTTTR